MEEHVFSDDQWKWVEIDFLTEEVELRKLIVEYEVPEKWIKQAGYEERNTLQMNRNINQKEAIWGSLVYRIKSDNEDSQKIFHFFLSRDTLVTGNVDFLTTESMDKELVLYNTE